MATLQRWASRLYEVALILTFVACVLAQESPPVDRCPPDYRYRVETCVMEAQVAPQAGGGLPLITERNKLEELCTRGILQKTIECLRDISARCSGNATRRLELDMLFSIEDWRRGRALLCEDLHLFSDHFDCVSRFGPRISSCILMRTQLFKRDVTEAGIVAHKTLHDITCNFAENIVSCLERPLARACPIQVVETMTSALHRFLPPACAPVPAVYEAPEGEESQENGANSRDQVLDHHRRVETMNLETIIVEGGEAEN